MYSDEMEETILTKEKFDTLINNTYTNLQTIHLGLYYHNSMLNEAFIDNFVDDINAILNDLIELKLNLKLEIHNGVNNER